MPENLYLTMWAVGACLIAVANIIAWTAYVCDRRSRRREAELWTAIADLQDSLGAVVGDLMANAEECDKDRQRLKRLENPSPRHRFENRPTVTRQQIALPHAPSVRAAIDPAWNGGTRTFDRLAAKHGLTAVDTGTWLPSGPDVGRVQLPMPLMSDQTGQIPRIIVDGELVTGEMEIAR